MRTVIAVGILIVGLLLGVLVAMAFAHLALSRLTEAFTSW